MSPWVMVLFLTLLGGYFFESPFPNIPPIILITKFMGVKHSNIIEVESIQSHEYEILASVPCQIYGRLLSVRSPSSPSGARVAGPFEHIELHPKSLHFLLHERRPSLDGFLLIVPQFSLLQHQYPQSLKAIIDIVGGVARLGLDSRAGLGIGWGRIARNSAGWGVVGTKKATWAYQLALKNRKSEGGYLSPQLLQALSQHAATPKCGLEKADVFAFGMMVVEIITREKLAWLFDYQNCEIKLKPLLQRLMQIKRDYGHQLYSLVLSMLEIQEEERLSWKEIVEISSRISPMQCTKSYRLLQNDVSPLKEQTSAKLSVTPTRSPHRSSRKPKLTIKSRTPIADKENSSANISPWRLKLNKRQ